MNNKNKNDNEEFFMNTEGDQISMIAEISTEPEGEGTLEMVFNKEIPVMPLRNLVMFPHVVMPVTIGRSSTLKLINIASLRYRNFSSHINISKIYPVMQRFYMDFYWIVCRYQ